LTTLGYPGCEYQIREALTNTIGEEKADFFFDKVGKNVTRLDRQKLMRLFSSWRTFSENQMQPFLSPWD